MGAATGVVGGVASASAASSPRASCFGPRVGCGVADVSAKVEGASVAMKVEVASASEALSSAASAADKQEEAEHCGPGDAVVAAVPSAPT